MIQEVIMRMMREFRDFAMRGNVADMAIGIVLGVAFGNIVSSLVGDVITPPLGVLLGGVNFTHLTITIQEAHGDVPEVLLRYGKFLQTIINFIIIAFAMFIIVKFMNSMKRKEEAAAAPPPSTPTQEELLAEIRDILRGRQ